MDKERFAVSAEGLRQLNAGRAPWSLVKELIQNCWDEAPDATTCDVTIRPQADGTTIVSAEDDGPGFAEISHAWTLMANTPKKADPTKRGRFNLGEKEILALALSATIETAGTTVTFPPEGGRTTAPNQRQRGTLVTMTMPWDEQQAEELRRHLRRFRPTECGLSVDGVEIPRRTPLASRRAALRTLVQHGAGLPMTESRRKTSIDVLERADGVDGWIYEMGIPIQTTAIPYDIDIGQKVPMPPNRDTVSASYLQDVMSETLNAMHDQMGPESFSENWVRTAVEDDRIEGAAVESVRRQRYGSKAVMWSSDTDANMRAAEAGYQVIHSKAMSAKERRVMRTKGGLQSAQQDFGRKPETHTPETTDNVRADYAALIENIGRILGMRPTVRFISAPDSQFMAQCSGSRPDPCVTVNTSFCSNEWLARRDSEQLELIIHELAHARANTPMEHGPKWGEACARAGGQIGNAIARGRLAYPQAQNHQCTPEAPRKALPEHDVQTAVDRQPAGGR